MTPDATPPPDRAEESRRRARRALGELPDPAADPAFRRAALERFLDAGRTPADDGGRPGADDGAPAANGEQARRAAGAGATFDWGEPLPPPPSPADHELPDTPFEDDLPPPPTAADHEVEPGPYDDLPPPPVAAEADVDDRAEGAPARSQPTGLARRRWPWAAILIAAFTLLWVGAPADPGWRVVDVEGAGSVRIGSATFSSSDRAAIGRRLISGATVQVASSVTLVLASAGNVLLEVSPGTELVLPTPRRMALRSIWDGELRSGVLRLSTGPDFHGTELVLATPGGDVHVTGTTLAVVCGESDTCVCVLEGLVRLGNEGGGTLIEPGMRRTRFFPTGATLDEPLAPEESARLDALRERAWLLVADESEQP